MTPEWLDADALSEFLDMRRKIKKPLTERAMNRLLTRLQALKDAGHDPNASLIQSADYYWLDVYEPRNRSIERRAPQDSRKEMDERFRGAVPPPAHVLARLKRVS